MKVLVLVVCLAAAAAAQLHPHGHIAGHTAGLAAGHGLLAAGQGAVSVHEQVYHTSAQPESLVQFQQFGKSVQQQVPLTGYQQTTLVTGQPASYFKTVQNIENPVLLKGEVQKFEKIEKIANVQKVELPAVTAYSGGYEQSAYIQKQPALASLSGYKSVASYQKPVETIYKKEVVTPAVSSYSAFPAASTYKQESFVAAKPAVTSYSAYSTAPAYKQESLLVSKPAVSSYSAFPAATAYKQESLFAAKPAVASYSAAFPSAMYGGSAMFPGYSQSAEGASSILKLYKDDIGTGDYQYGYATSNGISHDEQGKVSADSRSSEGSTAVSGSYSYTGPDGVSYTVKYIADEQGFRAFGDHLPKLSEEAQHAIDESAKYSEQKDY